MVPVMQSNQRSSQVSFSEIRKSTNTQIQNRYS